MNLLLVLFAVAALYWPGLRGELIVDDLPNLQPLHDMATGAIGWRDVVLRNDAGPLGRPLTMASFVVDYHFGHGAAFQYKRTNLLLHLACGTIFFLLVYLLFVSRPEFSSDLAPWYALFAASVWLTAPLFASTVLYVIQRMAQLAAFFSLLGMLLYVIARRVLGSSPRTAVVCLLLVFFFAWPAASLSKENGVLLPALVFLIELYWFQFKGDEKSRRILLTIHSVFFVVPALLGCIWLLLRWSAFSASYGGRGFSLSQRLLTEGRALWDYIRQLLVPDGLRMGVVQDDYPLSQNLLQPASTAVALIAWVLLFLILFRWRRESTARWIGFGVLFFLSGHLLESSIFPLELYFEHRNYLPATGLLAGLTAALAATAASYPAVRRMLPMVAFLPVLYGFVTYQRVSVWQSAEAIARIAETTHARSPRLQTALISMYTRDRDLTKALAHLTALANLDGGLNAAHAFHQVEIYCYLNHRPDPAEYDAVRNASRLPNSVYARERLAALADAIMADRCRSLDFNELREWLLKIGRDAEESRNWMSIFQMARIFELLGNPDRAIELLNTADEIDSARLEPGLIKIRILLAQGRRDDARTVLKALTSKSRKPVQYQSEMIEEYSRMLRNDGTH